MKTIIGSYTKRKSEGIYSFTMDQNGLQERELLHPIQNPTYLYLNKDILLSVIKDGEEGGIAYFNKGKLINQVTELGTPPCYVSMDLKRDLVLSANFHESRINTYLLTGFGLIDHQVIQYESSAKAHFVDYHAATDEVFVCLYGLAQVLIYGINKRRELVLKYTYQAPTLSGPRHLVLHPSLPYVYVLAEAISELLVLKRVDDTLVLVQSLSTLPVGEDEIKSASAIRFGKDAHYIYVSNRGHDSITVYHINEDGLCEWVQNVSSLGKNPRDFNLSPNGQVIVIANQDSDTLVSYQIDSLSGKLIKHLNTVEAYEPSCIVFQKEK